MRRPKRAGPGGDPPRPERLLAQIRFLAEDSSQVILGEHAQERMVERDIFDVDVFRILRKGRIKGEIEAGRRAGDWTVKVVDRIKGMREAGVVTVVMQGEKLFVVTVEWEDWR